MRELFRVLYNLFTVSFKYSMNISLINTGGDHADSILQVRGLFDVISLEIIRDIFNAN